VTEAALALNDEVALARAEHYGLLAALFAAPPTASLLTAAQTMAHHYGGSGERPTQLSAAWRSLAQALAEYELDVWVDEYEALFYGIGRSEVIPYGSYYLAGFMMEEPLAELRQWWAKRGWQLREAISEPEDHIAAELEAMRQLIETGDEAAERHFFTRFLWPWANDFAAALRRAPSAAAYQAVAELLEAFLTLEAFYWEVTT
jgi:TorA maturation chaperone TorD